jgi:hypothetical protein
MLIRVKIKVYYLHGVYHKAKKLGFDIWGNLQYDYHSVCNLSFNSKGKHNLPFFVKVEKLCPKCFTFEDRIKIALHYQKKKVEVKKGKLDESVKSA